MSEIRLYPRDIGRYRLYDEIAAGGMATVHIGRLLGPGGFARTVAVKRLHAQFARDPEFVSMFLDEAKLAARVHHPHVAATLDVVALRGELFLVMEYVQGESLARLMQEASKANRPMPPRVAATIIHQALQGLHAAHEAVDDGGSPLRIVHRDVSPQNILVGADGAARVVDFGVAKAAMRMQVTGEGQVKGKLAYMAPEQLRMEPVDRRTDLFASGVVLWEALTGERLFAVDEPGAAIAKILTHQAPPPSHLQHGIDPALDAVVLRALRRRPAERFETALEMARAIERATPLASSLEIAEWVREVAGNVLEARALTVKAIESASGPRENDLPPAPVTPGVEAEAATATVASETRALLVGIKRRRRRTLAATAGVLGLMALGLVWIFRPRAPLVTAETPPVATTPVTATEAPRRAPEEPHAPAVVPLPVAAPAEPATEARPAPIATAPRLLLRSSSRSQSNKRVRARRATPARPESSTAAHCTPPYNIDPDGVKRFKPECLR